MPVAYCAVAILSNAGHLLLCLQQTSWVPLLMLASGRKEQAPRSAGGETVSWWSGLVPISPQPLLPKLGLVTLSENVTASFSSFRRGVGSNHHGFISKGHFMALLLRVGWVNGWVDNKCAEGWMCGRMDGWMDGQTDGRADR